MRLPELPPRRGARPMRRLRRRCPGCGRALRARPRRDQPVRFVPATCPIGSQNTGTNGAQRSVDYPADLRKRPNTFGRVRLQAFSQADSGGSIPSPAPLQRLRPQAQCLSRGLSLFIVCPLRARWVGPLTGHCGHRLSAHRPASRRSAAGRVRGLGAACTWSSGLGGLRLGKRLAAPRRDQGCACAAGLSRAVLEPWALPGPGFWCRRRALEQRPPAVTG
jgi:hypothetical protein